MGRLSGRGQAGLRGWKAGSRATAEGMRPYLSPASIQMEPEPPPAPRCAPRGARLNSNPAGGLCSHHVAAELHGLAKGGHRGSAVVRLGHERAHRLDRALRQGAAAGSSSGRLTPYESADPSSSAQPSVRAQACTGKKETKSGQGFVRCARRQGTTAHPDADHVYGHQGRKHLGLHVEIGPGRVHRPPHREVLDDLRGATGGTAGRSAERGWWPGWRASIIMKAAAPCQLGKDNQQGPRSLRRVRLRVRKNATGPPPPHLGHDGVADAVAHGLREVEEERDKGDGGALLPGQRGVERRLHPDADEVGEHLLLREPRRRARQLRLQLRGQLRARVRAGGCEGSEGCVSARRRSSPSADRLDSEEALE